jgi:hypothetical protein
MAPSSADAGQGFFVTFTSNLGSPLALSSMDYRAWYPYEQSTAGNGIKENMTINLGERYYTEHCAAAITCAGNSGDSSLPEDGIFFYANYNGSVAVQFCLSLDGPITANCGVAPNPLNSYDDWLVGCYVPNGGFTCNATIRPDGDQIDVNFTINGSN